MVKWASNESGDILTGHEFYVAYISSYLDFCFGVGHVFI